MVSPVLFLAMFLFQIERKGLKLLDPPIRLVDVSSRQVVWDKEQDSMEVSIHFPTEHKDVLFVDVGHAFHDLPPAPSCHCDAIPLSQKPDAQQMYKEILKEGVFEESGSERTRWYAEMACNHCRHRAGLMTHEEIARKRAVQAAILLQEAQGKKKGKGKGGKKKK
jgi:hypothetical protein